jgi:hypothetical protein
VSSYLHPTSCSDARPPRDTISVGMLLMLNRAAGSGSYSVFSFANSQFGLGCRASKRPAESGPGPQTSTPVPRSEPLVSTAAGQYQTAGVRVPTAVAMPHLQGKLLGASLYVGCLRYQPFNSIDFGWIDAPSVSPLNSAPSAKPNINKINGVRNPTHAPATSDWTLLVPSTLDSGNGCK